MTAPAPTPRPPLAEFFAALLDPVYLVNIQMPNW